MVQASRQTGETRKLRTCVRVEAGLIAALMPGTSAAATGYSFAVIGDTPYGSGELSRLPGRIDQINAHADVRLAAHVGDISSPVNCSSSY